MTNEEREALIAQGWTPPVAVDPDIAEAEAVWFLGKSAFDLVFEGIKRGRELERAVMGNPIPEQIQEVTPPEPVNPDLAEANILGDAWHVDEIDSAHDLALIAIKRGRALAAAEAKPGMVWVKHDGSAKSPVALGALVVVKYVPSVSTTLKVGAAAYRDWQDITHYAVITPPAEDVA